MKKKNVLIIFLAALSMFVFGQGCFIIGPGGGGGVSGLTGNLEVNWLFRGRALCPSDVEDVVIEIRDNVGRKVMSDVIRKCTAGVHTLPSLDEGRYTVLLKGLDIDDAITWESVPRRIVVDADATAEVDINLVPAD